LSRPGGAEEALNLDQIAVWVAQQAVIDVGSRVQGGCVFKRDALCPKAFLPPVDVVGDQGDDHACRCGLPIGIGGAAEVK
jgi:hypothetical protein